MRSFLRGLLRAWVVFGIALFFVVAIMPSHTKAAINPQINFQGKLTNTDGTNVTNGTYSIVFSIYTVSSGGSNVWTETQPSVSVTDGVFRVALGSVTALPGSVDFNTNALYLGIKVGADAEMTPRVQFTAAPYAFNSDKLGGLASSGFAQLGPSTVQADGSTNSTFFVNKTAAGNLVQLQNTAVDVFTISNSGDIAFGQNANHTISVLQEASNTAGNNLSLSAGQGGAGAGANAGGNLVLQGGAGGGTGGNGGNVTIAAGALNGAGSVGSVIVKNPSDSATAFQVQNAAGTTLLVADATNNRIYVGATAADAVGVLLVLDTKNSTTDPTGVVGGLYYNSAMGRFRCFEGGIWVNCTGTETASSSRQAAFARPLTIGATTLTGYGLTVPNVSVTAAANTQVESNYVSFTTGAGANVVSGYATGAFTATRLDFKPVLKMRIRTGALITTTRIWTGLSSAAISGQDPTIASAAFATASYVGVGYSAAVNTGKFVCGSGDGANHTGVDTGVTVAINTYYDIVIDYYSVPGSVICAISTNGGAFTSVSKSTNLPATNTSLGINALVNNLTSAAARAVSVAYIGLEQN
jgi:hypothetical protein